MDIARVSCDCQNTTPDANAMYPHSPMVAVYDVRDCCELGTWELGRRVEVQEVNGA